MRWIKAYSFLDAVKDEIKQQITAFSFEAEKDSFREGVAVGLQNALDIINDKSTTRSGSDSVREDK